MKMSPTGKKNPPAVNYIQAFKFADISQIVWWNRTDSAVTRRFAKCWIFMRAAFLFRSSRLIFCPRVTWYLFVGYRKWFAFLETTTVIDDSVQLVYKLNYT